MFIKLFVACCGLILLLTGCGEKRMLKTPEPENLRILSLVTAADYILSELGAKEKIAAVDRHGRVLNCMQDVPVTVAGSMVSREMLRQYKINYAIIWYYQCSLIEVFNKEGIPVMVVEPVTVECYAEFVRKLGLLCGKNAQAEKLVTGFRQTLTETTLDYADKKSVYMELYAPWKSPSAHGYIDEILNLAGGRLAVSGQLKGTVSPEAVALAGPEVIFFVEGFGSAEEIAGRAALRNTPAVKNKRIYAVPRKLLCEGVAPEKLLKFLSDKIKEN